MTYSYIVRTPKKKMNDRIEELNKAIGPEKYPLCTESMQLCCW